MVSNDQSAGPDVNPAARSAGSERRIARLFPALDLL